MRFAPNVPVKLRTPTVVVSAGLPLGPHRFRLVVVNSRGEESQPVEVTVTVDSIRPLPPFRPPVPAPRPTPFPGPLRDPIR